LYADITLSLDVIGVMMVCGVIPTGGGPLVDWNIS
jgi:hypothetical protein